MENEPNSKTDFALRDAKNEKSETIAQLRSSELLLRVIADNVADLIAVVDSSGRRIWNNTAYAERLGYSPDEIRGTDSMVEIHPDDVSLVKQVFTDSMRAGRGQRIEYRMRHRNGNWVTLESEGRIAQNWNGHEKVLVIVARDITERKNREREEQERTRRMLDQAEALTDFSQSRELQEGELDRCFANATEIAARILRCDRASIWILHPSSKTLVCRSLFEKGEAKTATDFRLSAKDYPNFFAALEKGKFFTAESLEKSDALRELTSSGLLFQNAAAPKSVQTNSLSIIPLRRGKELAGLLACEQINQTRIWSSEDKHFVASLAESILLALEVRERLDAHQALRESQKQLAAELVEAAAYVRSLLPRKMREKGIVTDWRYLPSAALGGDAFGYHWLDEDHLAIYLLDVVGHGVRAALLSVSVLNILRLHALADTDFTQPSEVLFALNNVFQMDEQDQMYFTIWFGVYDKSRRQLSYSSAGHPPAILCSGKPSSANPTEIVKLSAGGLIIGAMPDALYESYTCKVEPSTQLLVFSDGLYEIKPPGGSYRRLDDFIRDLAPLARTGNVKVEELILEAQLCQKTMVFTDDCSILKATFE